MYKTLNHLKVFYQIRQCSNLKLSKSFYNTVLYRQEKTRRNFERSRLKTEKLRTKCAPSVPLSLKYLVNEEVVKENEKPEPEEVPQKKVHFPLSSNVKIEKVDTFVPNRRILGEYEAIKLKNELEKDKKLWLTSYENYDDSLDEINDIEGVNYGTPDPASEISNTPCGGCGALLHCKEPSLPGYIPSEIYKNTLKKGGTNLEAVICQRCYFLKHYNTALEVQVSASDYPKVLQTIGANKNAIVVLLVDLTDFPCSIWPGIADIFAGKPTIVVGNKVDLLPQDSSKYLTHVKKILYEEIKHCGFATAKVLNVHLVSATTGFGVEDLISTLFSSYKYRGDVYLVGSTNVGKSSLYNILLGSDLCKSKATDLIQRATTSVWPGTTLNLLKFPIKRATGNASLLRHKRLRSLKKMESAERRLQKQALRATKDINSAVLIGRIERTNSVSRGDENFGVSVRGDDAGILRLGVDENDPDFAAGRWCYDTPGVVQREQITDLLTSEELIMTLPKTIIRPRTFCIRPEHTLFIAGLARLDYLHGDSNLRFTVFGSSSLPISVVKCDIADQFYKEHMGSPLLGVPMGSEKRLAKWPGLEADKEFTVVGIEWNYACKDVVLSSAGWISISGGSKREYTLRAWTPEKRGIFLRDALLPSAVTLRGKRIDKTPSYKNDKYFKY